MKRFILILALIFAMPTVAWAEGTDGLVEYYTGKFIEAERKFQGAAAHGNAIAQSHLGVMYESGQGVSKDYATAIKWYSRAANQGNINAYSNLGLMYFHGRGVSQDYVEAHKWFNLAAASGKSLAAEVRELAASKMTREQIAEAQRLAREWRSKLEN